MFPNTHGFEINGGEFYDSSSSTETGEIHNDYPEALNVIGVRETPRSGNNEHPGANQQWTQTTPTYRTAPQGGQMPAGHRAPRFVINGGRFEDRSNSVRVGNIYNNAAAATNVIGGDGACLGRDGFGRANARGEAPSAALWAREQGGQQEFRQGPSLNNPRMGLIDQNQSVFGRYITPNALGMGNPNTSQPPFNVAYAVALGLWPVRGWYPFAPQQVGARSRFPQGHSEVGYIDKGYPGRP